MYVNGVKIYQFKAKYLQIKSFLLCLDRISKDVTFDDMKEHALKKCLYDFSVNCHTIDVSDIVNCHKYLMKRNNTKSCPNLLKKLLYYVIKF